MPFATPQDVGTSLMGYEKKQPSVPKSHLAKVAKERKLGAPKGLESKMTQAKNVYDASGYKPDSSLAYRVSGGGGGAM